MHTFVYESFNALAIIYCCELRNAIEPVDLCTYILLIAFQCGSYRCQLHMVADLISSTTSSSLAVVYEPNDAFATHTFILAQICQ